MRMDGLPSKGQVVRLLPPHPFAGQVAEVIAILPASRRSRIAGRSRPKAVAELRFAGGGMGGLSDAEEWEPADWPDEPDAKRVAGKPWSKADAMRQLSERNERTQSEIDHE